MSVLNEIGDNCVVLATESLVQIREAFREEMGRLPTLAELSEILTAGVRSCAPPLFEDVRNASVTIAGEALPGGSTDLRPGDLIGIRLTGTQQSLVVYLGRCGRFGDAVGIVCDSVPSEQSVRSWKPKKVLPLPVFVEVEAVHSGRWVIRGRRPDLVARFQEPAFYYHPDEALEDGEYGPWGLTESAQGEVRQLTEAEAVEVFGKGGGPREQVYLADELEAYLRKLLFSD